MTSRANGFVYFISPIGGGTIKIGYSTSPEQRLKLLAEWSPLDLEILAMAPGRRADENFIHVQFRLEWRRREWFWPSIKLTSLIERVSRSGQLPAEYLAPKSWMFERMPGHGKPGRIPIVQSRQQAA